KSSSTRTSGTTSTRLLATSAACWRPTVSSSGSTTTRERPRKCFAYSSRHLPAPIGDVVAARPRSASRAACLPPSNTYANSNRCRSASPCQAARAELLLSRRRSPRIERIQVVENPRQDARERRHAPRSAKPRPQPQFVLVRVGLQGNAPDLLQVEANHQRRP